MQNPLRFLSGMLCALVLSVLTVSPALAASSSSSSSSSVNPFKTPSGYADCAVSGGTCSFAGTRTVWFRACFETLCTNATKVATSSIACTPEAFGITNSYWAHCYYSLSQSTYITGLVATASTQSGSSRSASKAVDDRTDTRWEASNSTTGTWLKVATASTEFALQRIEIAEYGNRIRGYRLEYLNGATWTPLQEGTVIGSQFVWRTDSPITTAAVRIVTTTASSGQPSITEFRVIGSQP
ncbi:MAG: discoidin domain-containing protein [Rhodocyclaceae bacterium]